MKTIFSYAALLLLCAFAPAEDNSYYRNDCNLAVVVEGKSFELRDTDKYHAELLYKTASMNGGNSLKKQVDASITFYGNELKDEKDRAFGEKLEIEYAFNEGTLGEVSDLKVELKQNLNGYYQLPEESKVNITRLTWSSDRRSCVMSADIDCTLRKWGYPSESQPTVKLKGKMDNITVAVPAYIVVKNPGQAAEVK